jgi:hypothetical protein
METQAPGVLERESKMAALIANPPATAFLQLLYTETDAAEWLFSSGVPRRQAFVAGMEEKAAFHIYQKVYMYS